MSNDTGFFLSQPAAPYLRTPVLYLAARYTRRAEMRGYRDGVLADLGVSVPARWLREGSHQLNDEGRPINEDGTLKFPDDPRRADYWRRQFAQDDYEDVLAADEVVAFTEIPRSTNSRGGRHVEFGIALGAGKPVSIVGPRENVFCHLDHVRHFDTWDAFLEQLARRLLTAVNR